MGLPEQGQDAAFEGTIVVRMVLSVNHVEAVSTGDGDSGQCASAHLNGLMRKAHWHQEHGWSIDAGETKRQFW